MVLGPTNVERKARGWTSAQLNHELREAAHRPNLKVASPASLRVQISGWETAGISPTLPTSYCYKRSSIFPPRPSGSMTLTHELVLRNGHRTEISDSMLRYFIHQLAEHSRADNIAGPSFVSPRPTFNYVSSNKL